EAALLALGFLLLEVFKGAWILVPAIIGWVVAIVWILVCEAKGKDVDRWMKRVIGFQLMVGKDWFDYLKPGVKLSGGRVTRFLFNYMIPCLIAVLWIFVVHSA
ncbi:unnamed protein product, partial [marine sediment metagenome]